MRLIDLNKIPSKAFRGDRDDLVDALISTPTVDAVPVVRCKDCKHYNSNWCCILLGLLYAKPTDYCSRGERRTDTDD